MAIDVGLDCNERAGAYANSTWVAEGNSANATGTINYVCVFWGIDPINAEAGAFSASGNDLTCVAGGHAALEERGVGVQEYNAPGDFTAFNINLGEYIGAYAGTTGAVAYAANGVSGLWYQDGDQIPCGSVAFAHWTDAAVSVYATGTEAGAGLPIAVARHHYSQFLTGGGFQ